MKLNPETNDSLGCAGLGIFCFVVFVLAQFPEFIVAPVLVYAAVMILNTIQSEAGTFKNDHATYWDGLPRVVANSMTYTFLTLGLWCLGGLGFMLRLMHVEPAGLLTYNGSILFSYGLSLVAIIWAVYLYITQVRQIKKKKNEELVAEARARLEAEVERANLVPLQTGKSKKRVSLSSLLQKRK